jgi:hypothetical protein
MTNKNQKTRTPKTKGTKRTKGRPSSYKAEYCQELIQHMRGGLSFESFAGKIGKNRETLYEWASVHEDFSDAKKEAESLCQVWWENAGIAGMLGLKQTKDGVPLGSFNAAVWIFNMKNRFNWRDKHEHVGKNGERLSVSALVAKVDSEAERS